MKRKALWAFSMVLFLLISCTFLSLQIEKWMMPQVLKTAPDFSNPAIELDALFVDEAGMHLYRIGEDTGWEQGTRAYEMESNNYHIADSEIVLGYSGTYVVQYASKQPKDGEIVNTLQTKETQDDHWVVSSPIELSPLANLPDGCTVLEQSENALLVSALDAPSPFMQGRARSTLFGKGIALADPNAAQYSVYSINDTKTFLRQLPLLAILAVIFLFAVLLWPFSFPYLKWPRKYREILLLNGGLAAAMLIGMPFLLGAIDLPSSLLPQNNIFDFSHYTKEFEEIFIALETFTAQGKQTATAMFQSAASALARSLAVLLGGILLTAALVTAEAVLSKRRAHSGRHFRRAKE